MMYNMARAQRRNKYELMIASTLGRTMRWKPSYTRYGPHMHRDTGKNSTESEAKNDPNVPPMERDCHLCESPCSFLDFAFMNTAQTSYNGVRNGNDRVCLKTDRGFTKWIHGGKCPNMCPAIPFTPLEPRNFTTMHAAINAVAGDEHGPSNYRAHNYVVNTRRFSYTNAHFNKQRISTALVALQQQADDAKAATCPNPESNSTKLNRELIYSYEKAAKVLKMKLRMRVYSDMVPHPRASEKTAQLHRFLNSAERSRHRITLDLPMSPAQTLLKERRSFNWNMGSTSKQSVLSNYHREASRAFSLASKATCQAPSMKAKEVRSPSYTSVANSFYKNYYRASTKAYYSRPIGPKMNKYALNRRRTHVYARGIPQLPVQQPLAQCKLGMEPRQSPIDDMNVKASVQSGLLNFNLSAITTYVAKAADFGWNNLSAVNWFSQPTLLGHGQRMSAIPAPSVVAGAHEYISVDKKCMNPASGSNTYGWSPTAWFPGFDIAVPKVRGFVLPSGFDSKFSWFPRAPQSSVEDFSNQFGSYSSDEKIYDSLFGDRYTAIRKSFDAEFFAMNSLKQNYDFKPTNVSNSLYSTKKFMPSFDALFRDQKKTPGFCNASLSAINYGLKLIGNKIESKLLKVKESTTKWTNDTLMSVIGMGSFFNYSPLKSNIALRDQRISAATRQCERSKSGVVTTTNMTAISCPSRRISNSTTSYSSRRAMALKRHHANPVASAQRVSRCGERCQALSDLDLFIRSQRENVPIRNITLARMEYKKVLESFADKESSLMTPRQSASNYSHHVVQSRNLRDMMTASRGRRLNANHPLLRAYSRAVQMFRDVSDEDLQSSIDFDDDDDDGIVSAMSLKAPAGARGPFQH
jgi:hypothetical protein